jgi:hypothetical protein
MLVCIIPTCHNAVCIAFETRYHSQTAELWPQGLLDVLQGMCTYGNSIYDLVLLPARTCHSFAWLPSQLSSVWGILRTGLSAYIYNT